MAKKKAATAVETAEALEQAAGSAPVVPVGDVATEQLLMLDPSQIERRENARWSQTRLGLDALKASVKAAGGVSTPVEVEPMNEAGRYPLTAGYRRLAVVEELNKEGMGLLVPARIVAVTSEGDRLRRQLSENMDRENMSPMDCAVAIQRLESEGVERKEIRRIFSRPTGRKGLALAPASNAWLNIILRLMDYPKGIQERIHDGRIGVKGAYELGRVRPEKRQAIIDRIERERIAFIDMEEKDEKSILDDEAKLEKALADEAAAKSEGEAAQAAIEAAQRIVDERKAHLNELQSVPFLKLSEAEKKAHAEKIGGATTDLKAADKALTDAKKAIDKHEGKAKKAAEIAAGFREKLENARKALKAKKGAKPITQQEVQKAAAAEGESGRVPLQIGDVRAALKEIASEAKKAGHGVVEGFSRAVLAHIDAKDEPTMTPKLLAVELSYITGEERRPKG